MTRPVDTLCVVAAGDETRTVAAVLAGGRSTRMGRDKATAVLRGKPMLDHVLDAVRDASLQARLEPLVVGRAWAARAPAIPDPPGARGPAAGLLGALRHAAGRDVVLLATDQPFVRPATLAHLIDVAAATPDADAVVPDDGGTPQVTCALYRSRCLAAAEALVAENPAASLRSLLERIDWRAVDADEWRTWGEDGASWRSIDTPEDLAAAERA